MKILIVTTVKIGYDGLTNHILTYIKNMRKDDLQIDLVSARDIDPNIMPLLQTIGFNQIFRIECRDRNQIKYLYRLMRLIRTNKYDIVHVHGNSATLAVDMIAAYLGGCRHRIAHAHNTSCQHAVLNKILKPFFEISYTEAFACGKEAGEWLFGKNKEVYIVKNGKDLDHFRYDENIRKKIRKELRLADGMIAIGHVAAFVPTKNHKFMVEVFNQLVKRVDNYEMFLYGIDGDTKKATLEQIRVLNLEDKIHYMGAKENINDYMQAMDIMVLPSWYEGFPSVTEWEISGLPCVLSDTITRECNLTGSVKFVPIDNGEEPWVEAILNIDIHEREKYRENIDEIFSKAGFNIKTNAGELREKYIQIGRG